MALGDTAAMSGRPPGEDADGMPAGLDIHQLRRRLLQITPIVVFHSLGRRADARARGRALRPRARLGRLAGAGGRAGGALVPGLRRGLPCRILRPDDLVDELPDRHVGARGRLAAAGRRRRGPRVRRLGAAPRRLGGGAHRPPLGRLLPRHERGQRRGGDRRRGRGRGRRPARDRPAHPDRRAARARRCGHHHHACRCAPRRAPGAAVVAGRSVQAAASGRPRARRHQRRRAGGGMPAALRRRAAVGRRRRLPSVRPRRLLGLLPGVRARAGARLPPARLPVRPAGRRDPGARGDRGVDAGLVGALVLYGTPAATAAVGVLAFRAVLLGIPAGLGGAAFVALQRSLRDEATARIPCADDVRAPPAAVSP